MTVTVTCHFHGPAAGTCLCFRGSDTTVIVLIVQEVLTRKSKNSEQRRSPGKRGTSPTHTPQTQIRTPYMTRLFAPHAQLHIFHSHKQFFFCFLFTFFFFFFFVNVFLFFFHFEKILKLCLNLPVTRVGLSFRHSLAKLVNGALFPPPPPFSDWFWLL